MEEGMGGTWDYGGGYGTMEEGMGGTWDYGVVNADHFDQ